MGMKLNQHGVTAIQEKFVWLLSQGYSHLQATSIAKPARVRGPAARQNWAAETLAKPIVWQRLRRLLFEKKITDIDSEGLWHSDLADMIRSAQARKNDTALASFMRLRGQALGILKDRVVLSAEHVLPDADLVKQIAGDDKGKAAVLLEVLGADTFGEAAAPAEPVKKAA